MDKVITISDSPGGVDVAETDTALDTVVDMNFSYGVLSELPGTGVTLARGSVPAGAEVPPHAGPNLYAMYVISGSGTLTLQNAEGVEVKRLACTRGQTIIFPPNAQHGWINSGDAEFNWFGVDIAPR